MRLPLFQEEVSSIASVDTDQSEHSAGFQKLGSIPTLTQSLARISVVIWTWLMTLFKKRQHRFHVDFNVKDYHRLREKRMRRNGKISPADHLGRTSRGKGLLQL